MPRGEWLFCESGGPNNQGEEVLHLPVIVESAESSPQAATVAAKTIRKFLSKDNYGRPHTQYNAVMLIRILADNPGASFTRNLDSKFTATVKELLRTGKDPSVQQIVRETLAALYVDKAYDTNLTTLFAMWHKEQGGAVPRPDNRGSQNGNRSAPMPPMENYQRRRHETGLPDPVELAARIEEAKTSAKLLQQLVQSTAPAELQGNDLVKEFADRCQTAQRSVQGYINCDNPPPDDETMQTLIETSEQLSLAASKHQRAVLQARRAFASTSPPPVQNSVYPPGIGPPVGNTGYSSDNASPSSNYAPSDTQPLTAYHLPPIAPPSMQPMYSPPPMAPPSMQSNSTYSPPPHPPPSMRANLDGRVSDSYSPPVPSSLQAGNPSLTKQPPPIPRGAADTAENPFADQHAHVHTHDHDHDERYSSDSDHSRDDPYHHPQPTHPLTSSTLATVGDRPLPHRDAQSWRDPIPEEESNASLSSPKFVSSPSYVKRQESAEGNLTMHGGAVSPDRGTHNSAGGMGGGGGVNRAEAVSPVYERHSSGEISPVFESETRRYPSSKNGGGAQAGYRY
ncbi:hypothetical protein EJ08DRAFT_211170 [Tothia fuscella]|uniref:GAT domain-containing protein n=1 Tax=Tothia fuscella TaxID=1048955 RepID=A0A9P4NSU7_9PEZI|nr:hypothetical protein EJ08DRAFT_211170 [Tothia fuscella]